MRDDQTTDQTSDQTTDHTTDHTTGPVPRSGGSRPRTSRRRAATLAGALAGLAGIGALCAMAVLRPGGQDPVGVDDTAVASPAGPQIREPEPEPTEVPPRPEPADLEAEYSVVSGQVVDTPCWTYEGPALFVNNISDEDVALCHGALELWGEAHEGIVVPRGVGSVYGSISVEAVRTASSQDLAAGIDADDPAALGAVVDTLAQSYFPENGAVISLHEEITLGGVAANVTRVESTSESTRTKAFITAFAPQVYAPGPDEVRLFVIAVVTPYGNGDELIEQVADTWRWK